MGIPFGMLVLLGLALFALVVICIRLEQIQEAIGSKKIPLQRIPPQAMYFRDDIIIFDWESGVILKSTDGETWMYVSRIERRWFQ
jgi:hypothetical protein